MKKILIVEDELLIQKSLQKLLEKKGSNVSVESSGKEAIQKILSHNFDKIICDLMLSDITGFDVIEESKKKYSSKEIAAKFVIITAYTSDQTIRKASEYGCKILGKPFDDMNSALDIFMGEE